MKLSTLLFALTLVCAPVLSAVAGTNELETVITFDAETPPANLAIGPNGRMFMSVHPFYAKGTRVVEILKDGSLVPYPTQAWAATVDSKAPMLNGVLGLRVDRQGILWLLDGSAPASSGRVIGWDTVNEALYKVIYLAPPNAPENTFLNDLAVDRSHDAIYIADTATPDNAALIVVDLKTGKTRRVLEGSRFTRPEDIDMVIEGRTVTLGGAPARIGVNPITLDASNTWVYFAPMSAQSMYRVRTRDLLDETLDDAALAARVQRYGDKPVSDGSTVDSAGNVYVTAVADHAIGVISADGTYRTLFQGQEIAWADGFAVGPRNTIYFTTNELHRSAVLNDGTDTTKGLFTIKRFSSIAESTPGR
jgi:sugar lactone lactonase YvrE